MTKKQTMRLAGAAFGAAAALLMLFDVTFAPQFTLPGAVRMPDGQQENRFQACFAKRDVAIHERAFSMIDNPDVQREYISTGRDAARAACREAFPERLVTEYRGFSFNLIDLRFRYGH